MDGLRQVEEFLQQAGTFYLTTGQEDRPKCRPVAFHMLEGDRLYFAVGDFKEVYQQMRANPHVEFCATVGKQFLRYYGTAVFEPDDRLARQVLSGAPAMRQIYNEKTGYGLAVFHLEHATAEFRTMMGVQERFTFA